MSLNDFSNAEQILVDIDKALKEPSSFLYEDSISNDINNSSNKENDNEIQHKVRTRYGRRINKPKRFINFTLLLTSLVTS